MIIHDCKQGEDEWFKLRCGKPTSSEFSSLVTGTGEFSKSLPAYAMKLAGQKYVMDTRGEIADDWAGNKFTDRGTELEPEARADYAMTRQVQVQEVGFITDDMLRWGASTDGLVGDDGVVEFKNLIVKTMMELLVYLKNNDGKTPPGYIPQIQGELFVTGREWCDIVFYHPQFDPVIHRHYPNPKFHQTLEAQLKKVIAERNRILTLIKS